VLGIAVVVATFAGPVLAVVVTRHIDETRQRRARRMDIFRSLMGSRRTPLAFDRVRALNLVEIEFYGIPAVEASYKVIETLSGRRPLVVSPAAPTPPAPFPPPPKPPSEAP
jgi:hypothetical protein